jgi:hypothetical protein
MAMIGEQKSPQEEEVSKAAHAEQFVRREGYVQLYQSGMLPLTNETQYVDWLLNNAGVPIELYF